MKLASVRVVIREKINVGGYENIEPELEMVGELEAGDDPTECAAQLHSMAQVAWSKNALKELGWVVMRRKGDKGKLHECMQLTAGARAQLKTLL